MAVVERGRCEVDGGAGTWAADGRVRTHYSVQTFFFYSFLYPMLLYPIMFSTCTQNVGKSTMHAKCSIKCLKENVMSWSAMISEYDQVGRELNALELFSRMKVEQANEFVFASAVSACASMLAVDVGKRIHSQSMVLGYADVSFMSNLLVSMYMKYGRCSDALSVFMSSSERKSVAYNAIITGLVVNEQVQVFLYLLEFFYFL
ncbi:putative tetratricopeptide-like helical domain superfamily [Helianthus anomalus]